MNDLPEILLIEDDKDDRDLFEIALMSSGLRAVVAHAGGVADVVKRLTRQGAHAQRALPMVMVLDLDLPDLDGVTLLRYVRRDILPIHIPVVVLTGSQLERDRAVCEAMGVDDFLVKPKVFADLVAFVASRQRYLPGGSPGKGTTSRLAQRRQ